MNDHELLSIFQSDGPPSVERYRQLIDASKASTIELMVHPSRVDDLHRQSTAISQISEEDYACLRSEGWFEYVRSGAVAFVNSAELFEDIV